MRRGASTMLLKSAGIGDRQANGEVEETRSLGINPCCRRVEARRANRAQFHNSEIGMHQWCHVVPRVQAWGAKAGRCRLPVRGSYRSACVAVTSQDWVTPWSAVLRHIATEGAQLVRPVMLARLRPRAFHRASGRRRCPRMTPRILE